MVCQVPNIILESVHCTPERFIINFVGAVTPLNLKIASNHYIKMVSVATGNWNWKFVLYCIANAFLPPVDVMVKGDGCSPSCVYLCHVVHKS